MSEKHTTTRAGRSQWFDEKTGEPVSPGRHREIDAHYKRLMHREMEALRKDFEQ